jgi:hypothetical protein|nr:MAG TPA: hypothetical protein [Caudoviricetes sp.]
MTNEELEKEVKRLEEQLTELRFKILESKGGLIPYKPYEVEVPEDIDDYYYTNEYGKVDFLAGYNTSYEKNKYIRGLAFKTEEEAEQYDKERILLFKMHKWAEEHNGGWTPNWDDYEEKQYYVVYDYEDKKFYVRYEHYSETFTKLPYFKSYNLAEQFIKEFGEEIKEVLC